jgi:hypothetical protein
MGTELGQYNRYKLCIGHWVTYQPLNGMIRRVMNRERDAALTESRSCRLTAQRTIESAV